MCPTDEQRRQERAQELQSKRLVELAEEAILEHRRIGWELVDEELDGRCHPYDRLGEVLTELTKRIDAMPFTVKEGF